MLRIRFANLSTEVFVHVIDEAIQLSFIEYIELQDPNRDPDSEARHLRKEKEDYDGSELKISKDGYDNLIKMYIEVEKRTPESNGIVHIYEDYAGYGIIEVLEKQVR